jgi:hypothetical protein
VEELKDYSHLLAAERSNVVLNFVAFAVAKYHTISGKRAVTKYLVNKTQMTALDRYIGHTIGQCTSTAPSVATLRQKHSLLPPSLRP